MKIRLLFSIVLSLLLIQSCSSGTDKSKNNQVVETKKDSVSTKEKFATGQVIENIACRNDASQSYAMYLPSNYSTTKTFPVIYAFDAHGVGKLPVSMYKNLAEKYGYILIGSNNSKNGNSWEESQAIANSLFSDSQDRLSINPDRIYLLGFSGGARVANGLAITNGAIAGVICCGAAAPAANSKDPRSNYTFLGIAGNKDFNYIEMRRYDMIELAGRQVKHAFIEFDGKHEWPKEEIMSDGFLWTELNAIRTKKAQKNDSLISDNIEPMMKKIIELQKNKKTFETYNLARKAINFFDGLTDLSAFYAIYNPLKANAEIDKKLKEESAEWKKEDELKQYYQEAFQSKNIEWWKKDIASVNQKIKNGTDKSEALMYARTLDYLSLVAYMQTIGAFKQNNVPAAKMFCQIYVIVDPTNNEAHYLTASVNAKEGNTKDALKSLNDALKNGFTDLNRLQSDSTFLGINSTEEFKAICKKLADTKTNVSQ